MRLNARWLALGGTGTAALGVVVLRAFPPAQFAFYPQCPVHRLLGLLCPGCGGTRALSDLCSGQWQAAFRENALVAASMPLALSYCAVQAYSGLRWNRWRPARIPKWASWVALLAAALFAGLRNL